MKETISSSSQATVRIGNGSYIFSMVHNDLYIKLEEIHKKKAIVFDWNIDQMYTVQRGMRGK